jgi:hypothetical protein
VLPFDLGTAWTVNAGYDPTPTTPTPMTDYDRLQKLFATLKIDTGSPGFTTIRTLYGKRRLMPISLRRTPDSSNCASMTRSTYSGSGANSL